MPERTSLLAKIFSDPWRKIFSVALAAGLWVVIHRQLMDSVTLPLSVMALNGADIPAEVLRRDRLFVIESEEWRLVGWNGERFSEHRSIELSIEAPNDVLATFRANPFGILGPFDFRQLSIDEANKNEVNIPISLSKSGPLSFGRAGELRDATLRIDGAEELTLKFRRYRREIVSLRPSDLAVAGLDERIYEIDTQKSKIDPERIAIRLPEDATRPPTNTLFLPIVVSNAEDLVVQLTRAPIWKAQDLHFADFVVAEPTVRLVFSEKGVAEVPAPVPLAFNPAKKIQGYFLAIDAELPINPRDFVDFDPLQIDQVQLRWKRVPTALDQEELAEAASELQNYIYFYADLSPMLAFDRPAPSAESDAKALPFQIRMQDCRTPIEVGLRDDTPARLRALLQWVDIAPADAAELHCWRRP